MDQQLAASPVGQFVPVTGHDRRYDERYKHVAFLPHELPDDVQLESSTWKSITDAHAAIARLDGALSELAEPTLLVRPLIRREAVSTSALKGTCTGFGDLLGAEASREEQQGDVREVLNYVRATAALGVVGVMRHDTDRLVAGVAEPAIDRACGPARGTDPGYRLALASYLSKRHTNWHRVVRASLGDEHPC